jgi:hypothetical protein
VASPAHCPGVRENRKPAIDKLDDMVNFQTACLMLVTMADNASVLVPSLDLVAKVRPVAEEQDLDEAIVSAPGGLAPSEGNPAKPTQIPILLITTFWKILPTARHSSFFGHNKGNRIWNVLVMGGI